MDTLAGRAAIVTTLVPNTASGITLPDGTGEGVIWYRDTLYWWWLYGDLDRIHMRLLNNCNKTAGNN